MGIYNLLYIYIYIYIYIYVYYTKSVGLLKFKGHMIAKILIVNIPGIPDRLNNNEIHRNLHFLVICILIVSKCIHVYGSIRNQ